MFILRISVNNMRQTKAYWIVNVNQLLYSYTPGSDVQFARNIRYSITENGFVSKTKRG